MIWPEVITEVVIPMLEADDLLTDELGGFRVYMAQASRPVQIPSVEWLIVSDRLTETLNQVQVQFDYWANSAGQAAVIEERLRSLLHRDRYRTFGDLKMAILYDDSHTHEFAKPGVIHRSLRFRFDVVRTIPVLAES